MKKQLEQGKATKRRTKLRKSGKIPTCCNHNPDMVQQDKMTKEQRDPMGFYNIQPTQLPSPLLQPPPTFTPVVSQNQPPLVQSLSSNNALNDTLASVLKGQQKWQDHAINVMSSLATKQDNALALEAVPVFTGKDKTIKIEDWIRAVEKAALLTDLSEKRIALQKTRGTPSRYTENQIDASWAVIKKTLESWYARSTQPINGFFNLDRKPQRANETLHDYIQGSWTIQRRLLKAKCPIKSLMKCIEQCS